MNIFGHWLSLSGKSSAGGKLHRIFAYILLILFTFLGSALGAEKTLYLKDSDSFEFIRGLERDTVFITGAVFHQDVATIVADTAIWIKGEQIILIRDVFVEDTLYSLSAGRVVYDLSTNSAHASGDTVVLISRKDSILAKGINAYYNRDSSIFRMWDRPSVFLRYQDSTRRTRIDADRISVESKSNIGYADGNVIITQQGTESRSGRAILYVDDEIVLLLEDPELERGKSKIKGDTLVLYAEESKLQRIQVTGNATGNFKEPAKKDSTVFDIIDVAAAEIDFRFDDGELNNVLASGQAYSFYFPGTTDSSEIVKNNVSGDTLRLFMSEGELSIVEVIGGAEGEYLTGKFQTKDTVKTFVEDTVIYVSDSIKYALTDSTITLNGNAAVRNKTVSLTAHKINYNTSRELVTAYDDSVKVDTIFRYLPVVLKDGSEEIIGSYLEYSMDTEKGMLRKTKSEYETAYYRGEKLFREKRDVYFVDDGCYTTCDQEEPHFHFQSKHMKMIQNDKIVARPVIFYIEKLPVFAIPYYVFPTKSGRHSGFLPFSIGNYERGDGYIHNVGYYWAASEYWDILWALDYTENLGFRYRSQFNYNIRYKLSGYISGSYVNQSTYSGYSEFKSKRWDIAFNHSHTISPTFSIKANGQFLSDKSYYTDYSTNLDDRTNRVISSKASILKKFGNASLSAQFTHDDYLDDDKRIDWLPRAGFSFPNRPIFRSSSTDADGNKETKWYSGFTFGYRADLNNYNARTTDTTGFKSRREYITMHHRPSLGIQGIKLFSYLSLTPSFSYQETWYKVFETDQSMEAGIDASEFYRRAAYSASLTATTDLYGMLEPNIFGLQALRHVLTPRVTFSWAPEITQNDNLKSYTGVGAGGSKQRTMSFGLNNVFQTKIKSGEESKKYDLFYINGSASYNFEAEGKKWSNLTTSFGSTMLQKFNMYLSGSMVHDLYKPGTEELQWWSPFLQSFSISTRFNTGGIFNEIEDYRQGDSSVTGRKKGAQKWSLSVNHSYSESGRGESFSKRHQINYSLKVALTPTLDFSFSQSYDIANDKSINKSLQIHKNLHCWEASFGWVPQGSNKGYWFKINIISIPEIKYEERESGIITPFD